MENEIVFFINYKSGYIHQSTFSFNLANKSVALNISMYYYIFFVCL